MIALASGPAQALLIDDVLVNAVDAKSGIYKWKIPENIKPNPKQYVDILIILSRIDEEKKQEKDYKTNNNINNNNFFFSVLEIGPHSADIAFAGKE